MRNNRCDTSIPTFDAYPLTVGILGLGRIGSEVAKMAKAFHINLLYYDSVRKTNLERELGIGYVPFHTLLKECDIVSIHAPLTAEIERLVGAKEFALMKRDAYLVNTSRGGIVDENALVTALTEGRLAGAALGVYGQEPPTEKHPLYRVGNEFPNLVLVPHMAIGATTKKAIMRTAAEDVLAVLEGGKPKYPLNKIP